jgi:hypothetical protein
MPSQAVWADKRIADQHRQLAQIRNCKEPVRPLTDKRKLEHTGEMCRVVRVQPASQRMLEETPANSAEKCLNRQFPYSPWLAAKPPAISCW